MSRPRSAVLARLRQETSTLHAALDSHRLLRMLLSPNISQVQYAEVLQVFWSLYQPFETQLRAFEDWSLWGLELSTRWKAPLLEGDLEALGLSTRELSPYSAVPHLNHFAAAWGTLYVLEGASLGAQFICRSLAQSPVPLEAQRFFTHYGPRTQGMWQSFALALTKWSEQTIDIEQTFTAARATFQAFADCLAAAELKVRS